MGLGIRKVGRLVFVSELLSVNKNLDVNDCDGSFPGGLEGGFEEEDKCA